MPGTIIHIFFFWYMKQHCHGISWLVTKKQTKKPNLSF